jgi:hypothetical protein
MDREGIDTMVIMETPGAGYIGKVSPEKMGLPDAAVSYPGRFAALYCGDACSMLYTSAKTGSASKEDTSRFTTLLSDAVKSGKYRGFGEIGMRHFPPSGMPETYDLTVPGDNPLMFAMADVAAQYGVPIDIHMEADSATVSGLEKLLSHNRNATIIWDHAGWGNTGGATPELMSRLLKENPNLYTSIKYRKDSTGPAFLDTDGKIDATWLNVVKEFPDRFMMGSDIKPGWRDDEFRFVKSHVSILEQMPADIREKVARENAKRIFHLS